MQSAQRIKSLWEELLPLGKREGQTLEPPGLAGCHTTLQSCYTGRDLLASSSTANSSNRERQSDRFLSSRGPTKVGVGVWIGGRGLNT